MKIGLFGIIVLILVFYLGYKFGPALMSKVGMAG